MIKYRIKVSYSTGDSFSTYDDNEFIDLIWNNLKIAKENLQAIQDHYKWYKEVEHYRRNKSHKELYDKYKQNWWIPSFNKDVTMLHYKMKLKADNGNLMQQRNFWCGYFESLQSAEIVSDEPALKFEL